jgi:hypothetical protein
MKLAAIVLAATLALSSTAALAQAAQGNGTAGYGSVVAPSVGSYYWPSVGTTQSVPTWGNTTSAPTIGSASTVGSTPFSAPSSVRR